MVLMRYLLDVNALVASGFLQHEFHDRVAQWVLHLTSKEAAELATCSITELGFVRVLTQASQYGFTIDHAHNLLLRLKQGKTLKFTSIADDHDIFRLGLKPQSKPQTVTSQNSPRRKEQFLRPCTRNYGGIHNPVRR
jgi:predicted nucleic acid-binding protein